MKSKQQKLLDGLDLSTLVGAEIGPLDIPLVKREDGHIDWTKPATEILNRARGFQPWPGAYGFLRGQRFHIWRGVLAQRDVAPGRLIAEAKRLFAGCGDASIELLEVQLEGKKRMAASAFLNGFSLASDERFI